MVIPIGHESRHFEISKKPNFQDLNHH